jgi:hypothetical protein
MDNKEVEELAEALIENERKNCTNCQEVNKDCWECEAEFIIKSGYHKVEPVVNDELADRITHIISDNITCPCYLCVGDLVTPKLLPLMPHYEPVTLKVLGDEEIKHSGYYCRFCESEDCRGCGVSAYKAGNQATIDQYKGQLYRRIE